jgi:hypothetical protein
MSGSRMEKYENMPSDGLSRTQRNQQIYNSTDIGELSRIRTNSNVSVISDAPKEIDLDKIRNYINSLNGETGERKRRISLELPPEEKEEIVRREEKDYDINSVLERAKEKRELNYQEERYHKINNTQTGLEILKNIKIREEKSHELDPDITGPIDELNTEEKSIVDLIQNIQEDNKTKKKDLFEDLMGTADETKVMGMSDEIEMNPEEMKEALLNITQDLESIKQPDTEFTETINIEKEKIKNADTLLDVSEKLDEINDKLDKKLDEKVEVSDTANAPKVSTIDKSFYTNSMTFNKSDFEGFEELEKNAKKTSTFAKITIAVIVVMLLVTIFLIVNFVFDLKII